MARAQQPAGVGGEKLCSRWALFGRSLAEGKSSGQSVWPQLGATLGAQALSL